MFLLVHIGLAVVLFTAAASCYSKFIRPPEFDGDQDADNDMRRNNRYDDGETVPILFDTNILETLLYICQRLPNRRKTLDWLIGEIYPAPLSSKALLNVLQKAATEIPLNGKPSTILQR